MAWKKGDIIQIDHKDELFGGCLMVVSESKAWGAQGYVIIPGKGCAFLRKKFDDGLRVGHIPCIDGDDDTDAAD